MANQQPVYISIDSYQYKKNKVNLLSSQADLINSMKRLENIKILRAGKSQAKKQLYILFGALSKNIEKIQNKLPEPKIPNQHKTKIPHIKIPETEETNFSKNIEQERQRDLDLELSEIKAKLRKLNS